MNPLFYKNFTPLAGSRFLKAMDLQSQTRFRISGQALMESAGSSSALEILKHPRFPLWKKKPFVILCGPGGNGGDGLVLARHLLSHKVEVQIFCKDSSKELTQMQKQRLKAQKVPLYPLKDSGRLKKALHHTLVIVDALFGVGLSHSPEEEDLNLIKLVNGTGKEVLSLDNPSGLNVDSGEVWGQAVKAHWTFSFGLNKPGFYLREGPALAGQIIPLPLGFPQTFFWGSGSHTHFLVERKWVSSVLPQRQATDHKARQGHLLVLAGREGMWGAGALCATAAYRMGAGYVTWSSHEKPPPLKVPEALIQSEKKPELLLARKTAVALGPGLGTGPKTKKIITTLKKTKLPVVVDADAFSVCVSGNMWPLPAHWVLTPHTGELARLFKVKASQVERDRCGYAVKASLKTGALVLLKGFHSLLAYGKKCWIIPTGNCALSKAGTGDVLTGFIGALLARPPSPTILQTSRTQKTRNPAPPPHPLKVLLTSGRGQGNKKTITPAGSPVKENHYAPLPSLTEEEALVVMAHAAAASGAFLHGLLAEEWVHSGRSRDSLLARDLGDRLPALLQKIQKP